MGGKRDQGVSVSERAIGEQGIGERVIGEREILGEINRGVNEKKNTIWMKSLTIFSGELHLLHHYESNLSHLLAF